VWREDLAKSRHVRLETVGCGCRRAVPPDLVDQALVRHDLAGTEQQGGENGPLLTAAQIEGVFLDLGFEHTEDAKPEGL
jgi:hypothetical protein